MKTLLVVLGLPGCGKDTVALILKERGIPVYGLGDVVRNEVRNRDLPITKEIQEAVAKEMRVKHGKDIFARLLGEELEKERARVICVNGPRTLDELQYLERHGRIVTLEVLADEQKRFERCKRRGNRWDPKTIADLRTREKSNLEQLGLAGLLKTDKYPRYVIDNNGTKAELKEKVLLFLGKLAG